MSALRMVFLTVAAVISLGIYLTGLNTVHWLLFAPVGGLAFAAMTGICPGLMLWKKLGFKDDPLACGISKRSD